MLMRSCAYRLYPTKGQTEQLNQMLGDFCLLYNAALEERQSAYRHGVTLNYVDQALQPEPLEFQCAAAGAAPGEQSIWSLLPSRDWLIIHRLPALAALKNP